MPHHAGEPSPASVLKSSHLALEPTLEKLPTVQVQLLGRDAQHRPGDRITGWTLLVGWTLAHRLSH